MSSIAVLDTKDVELAVGVQIRDKPGLHNCSTSAILLNILEMSIGTALIVVTAGMIEDFHIYVDGLIPGDVYTASAIISMISGVLALIVGFSGLIVAMAQRGFPCWFLLVVLTFGFQIAAFVLSTEISGAVRNIVSAGDWEHFVTTDPTRCCRIEADLNCAGYLVNDCNTCKASDPNCDPLTIQRCPAKAGQTIPDPALAAECLAVENETSAEGCKIALNSFFQHRLNIVFAVNLTAVVVESVGVLLSLSFRCCTFRFNT